ncbi:MAG: hypothetical protein Q7U57_03130 [Methylovulum sp.]|nr:hypothetical protein [Methylovulum sp.]
MNLQPIFATNVYHAMSATMFNTASDASNAGLKLIDAYLNGGAVPTQHIFGDTVLFVQQGQGDIAYCTAPARARDQLNQA